MLFFDKGTPTKKVWYYQVDKHFTKTAPLTEADMAEFIRLQKSKGESENSWTIDVADLDENFDLSVKNPNKKETVDERTPMDILGSLKYLNYKSAVVLNELTADVIGIDDPEEGALIAKAIRGSKMKEGWKYVKLGEVCVDFIVPQRDKPKSFDGDIPWCRIEDIEGRYLNGSKSNKKLQRN